MGGLCLVLAFGVNLEQRTALRREPMTDLGVFSCASWAIWSGDNPYHITDWHGWHYQYPPALAILFGPLANPLPEPLPALAPGERRTDANTPWGYCMPEHKFYGLHKENIRFFCIVASWYLLSVVFCVLAAHAVACVLEGRRMTVPPPDDLMARRRWWLLRLLPLLVCAGSIGTDLSRGQIDVLLLGAIALGMYWAANAMDGRAGLILSFPGSVKLMPPLLLIYPFWNRRWRMSAMAIAGLLVFLAVLPLVVCGPSRAMELYRTWVQVLVKPAMGGGRDTSRRGELTGMNSTDNQSLLAAIHNWQYHGLPRGKRPKEASSWARTAAYGAGAVLLILVLAASARPRGIEISSIQMVVSMTCLTGVWLVASPIVHNYYYVFMLPLVTALLWKCRGPAPGWPDWNWKLVWPVMVFMAVDLIVRLPGIGGWLRDRGTPLLSLMILMVAGIVVLMKERRTVVGLKTPEIVSIPSPVAADEIRGSRT